MTGNRLWCLQKMMLVSRSITHICFYGIVFIVFVFIIYRMDTSDQEMDFMSFSMMNKAALSDYCRKYGFPVTGTKEELAAMAYTAYRTKAPIQPSELEKILTSRAQYKERLVLPSGHTVMDPCLDREGWIGEADGGTSKWPSLSYDAICNYIKMTGVNSDSNYQINLYKEGKAYSYFQCDFVKEIKVKEEDIYKILKCKVTRSQCINDDPHSLLSGPYLM